MRRSRSFDRLVPGAAAAAVTLAALAAVWLSPRDGEPALASERPSLQAGPADVVKAPPGHGLRPATCRDCEAPMAPARL